MITITIPIMTDNNGPIGQAIRSSSALPMIKIDTRLSKTYGIFLRETRI